jgi:hypothetical protein
MPYLERLDAVLDRTTAPLAPRTPATMAPVTEVTTTTG